jgi:hypothetical protein
MVMGAQRRRGAAVATPRIDMGVPEDDLPDPASELPVLPELFGLCDGINPNPRCTQGSVACRLAIAAM